MKLSHTNYPCLHKKITEVLFKNLNWIHDTFPLSLCPSPREGFCRPTTTFVVYITRYSNTLLYPPSVLAPSIQAYTTVINTSSIFSSRIFIQDYVGKVPAVNLLQALLSLLAKQSFPYKHTIAQCTIHFKVSRRRELFPRLFFSNSSNASKCSYLAVQLFFLLFTPPRTKYSSVLREEGTQTDL